MKGKFSKIKNFTEEHNIFEKKCSVLAAVSGGPDSVFLLHFLSYLSKRKEITVKVAYIHHHMRPEAEEEAVFVNGLAESCGFLFYRGDIRIEGKSGVEEQGRILRYRQLYNIAKTAGCDRIATGHTLDDQAETVLMHLVKGAGLAGLRGMLPVSCVLKNRDILLVRPLLCITKSAILEALKREGKEYRIDSYNLSGDFFRNRIRQELLPLLNTYNPAVAEQIGRTALLLQDDFAFLKGLAEKSIAQMSGKKGICMKRYRKLHVSARRMLAALLREKITGNVYRSFDSIEKARKRLDRINSDYLDKSVLEKIMRDSSLKKMGMGRIEETFLKVPSKILLEDGRTIEADETAVTVKIFANSDRFTCYLDADKTGRVLRVRSRKEGDFFIPLGMKKRKKLARLLIDRKVPLSERDRLPVFEAKNGIAWVCGLEISEKFKVTKKTEKVLRISVKGG